MDWGTIDFEQIVQSAWKDRKVVAALLFGCVIVSVFISTLIPKTYKSTAAVAINSRYFQTSMVRDFVAETYDPSEMRSQREALVRESLSDDFIDSIGSELGMIHSMPETRQRSLERSVIRENIEVFILNSVTFHIGFRWGKPETTQRFIRAVVARIQEHIINTRTKGLIALRDSVGDRIEQLQLSLQRKNANQGNVISHSEQFAGIQKEIQAVLTEIQALQQKYTANHPKVLALKNRLTLLRNYLAEAPKKVPEKTANSHYDWVIASSVLSKNEEMITELAQRFNSLNIAIQADSNQIAQYVTVVEEPTFPLSPVWPKKSLFATWGLMLGILLSITHILALSVLQQAQNRKKILLKDEENQREITTPAVMPVIDPISTFPAALLDAMSALKQAQTENSRLRIEQNKLQKRILKQEKNKMTVPGQASTHDLNKSTDIDQPPESSAT